MNPLEGRQLRYLIGGDDDFVGRADEVVELSYDAERTSSGGLSVKYGNLFNEKYSEQSEAERAKYAPYLEPGDTAEEYGEGQIDPDGQGWDRNLQEQFDHALAQGFDIIELDNADSYDMDDVLDAVTRAETAGLSVLAKNPMICSGDKLAYISHPAVLGVVVERSCGTPLQMDGLRRNAGKPTLPVWFVAFGSGKQWADECAAQIVASQFVNMGVTYDPSGQEYEDSKDIQFPIPGEPDTVPIITIQVSVPEGVTVTVNGVPIG